LKRVGEKVREHLVLPAHACLARKAWYCLWSLAWFERSSVARPLRVPDRVPSRRHDRVVANRTKPPRAMSGLRDGSAKDRPRHDASTRSTGRPTALRKPLYRELLRRALIAGRQKSQEQVTFLESSRRGGSHLGCAGHPGEQAFDARVDRRKLNMGEMPPP